MINMQTCFERAISCLNINLRWQIFSCVRKDTLGCMLFTIRWCCQSSRNIRNFTCKLIFLLLVNMFLQNNLSLTCFWTISIITPNQIYYTTFWKHTGFIFRLCFAYDTIVKKLHGTVRPHSIQCQSLTFTLHKTQHQQSWCDKH